MGRVLGLQGAANVVKTLKVRCPECQVGVVPVHIVRQGLDAEHLHNANDPRRCPACQKFFQLRIRLDIVGVRIPASVAGAPASSGEIIRTLIGAKS